jgi:N-acyl-L-homoserine lactone synthetase
MADDLTLEDAAKYWDDLTTQFMALSPDVRFAVAETPQEQEAVFRARYAEVVRRGWATAEDMPGGIERDEYDERAALLVGWHGDRMIMVGRLVFPSADGLLPTEASFNLKIEPHKQLVDAGRGLRLQPDLRDEAHTLFMGLMSFAWQVMRGRGYTHVCAAMSERMLGMYQMMGIHWDVLADPRPYWGEMRYPCKFDLLRTTRAFMGRM